MKSSLHLLTDAAIGESSSSAHFQIFSQVTTARTETLKQATMGRKNNAKQQQQQEQTKPTPEKKAAPAPEPKKQQKQQPQPAAKEAPAATKGGKKGGKK